MRILAKTDTAAKAEAEEILQPEAVPVTFLKEQVLTFRRYAERQDLLAALLEDGKAYTFGQIDKLIDDFMKGKVK